MDSEEVRKQQIQIKVRDQQGAETTFKVKKETKFEVVCACVCWSVLHLLPPFFPPP